MTFFFLEMRVDSSEGNGKGGVAVLEVKDCVCQSVGIYELHVQQPSITRGEPTGSVGI